MTDDTLPPWPEHTPTTAGRPIAERIADLAVGKVAFVFDEHRRMYPANIPWRDRSPRNVSQRHFFVPTLIIDETRQSWITAEYGKALKRGKQHSFGRVHTLIGLQDVEDRLWWHENRARIVSALDTYSRPKVSYEQLRRIAAIIDEK